jgi:hypothetical protein
VDSCRQVSDPVRSLVSGLPLDLEFRTKGQLATGIVADVLADGVRLNFVCGDEVYGSCTELREFLEGHAQGYVLRVPPGSHLALPAGIRLTCAQAVRLLLPDARRWEVRSAGKGSKGERWYGWAWLGTASPRHWLLIRRHRTTGELAFHYCYVPEGQPVTMTRLIRAAGLRWPAGETFEPGKDCFGLDQSQVRLYTAIARHTVLVMAALAICAVTAALLRDRTSTQAPPPARPGQPPPADPGMIALTVPEIMAPTPPGPRPLAPPANPARHTRGDNPGQLANGYCRARDVLDTCGQPSVGAENLCDQAVFVKDATCAVVPPDPEMVQVGDAPGWSSAATERLSTTRGGGGKRRERTRSANG